MPQSLSMVIVHVVFSTKNRAPLISDSLQSELFAYLAKVATDHKCHAVKIGGTNDHIHVGVQLSRTLDIAKLVEELKSGSSRWMKERGVKDFYWQRGYSVFSVSHRDVGGLVAYIANQGEHHRKLSFQEEYRALLVEHGIECEETYLWD